MTFFKLLPPSRYMVPTKGRSSISNQGDMVGRGRHPDQGAQLLGSKTHHVGAKSVGGDISGGPSNFQGVRMTISGGAEC